MRFLKFLTIIFSIFILSSCTTDEGECNKEKNVYLRINFYKETYNDITKLTTTTSLKIDSMWVNGLGIDSFLYQNSKNLNYIKLPLKKLENQSDFIIRFNNTIDTISIFYQNNDKYYLSFACGCVITHTLDEVVSTNHYIKSTSILNREIYTTDAENIKIFN